VFVGVQRVFQQVPEERFKNDLEKYRNLAVKLGATDAKIVKTEDVVFDERTLLKCINCRQYGKCAMCPPVFGMKIEDIRKIVNKYRYAVFIIWKWSSKEFKVSNTPPHIILNARPLWNIMGKVESAAFYDGYYFAFGFGAGACRWHLCGGAECTHPMIKLGGKCRNPMKCRPSMEGSGMDAFRMATKVGWDVYPIGMNCLPEQVPSGCRLVLVLID